MMGFRITSLCDHAPYAFHVPLSAVSNLCEYYKLMHSCCFGIAGSNTSSVVIYRGCSTEEQQYHINCFFQGWKLGGRKEQFMAIW